MSLQVQEDIDRNLEEARELQASRSPLGAMYWYSIDLGLKGAPI